MLSRPPVNTGVAKEVLSVMMLSSKAMEPMAAVHLFNESLNSNVKLSVYVGDEDSTTAAHIKEKVPYPLEKWTDIVHAKRLLTTRLYNLSQCGKFVNSSTLSQKVINYLVKCFTYSVSQNKGNLSAVQKAFYHIRLETIKTAMNPGVVLPRKTLLTINTLTYPMAKIFMAMT